MKILTMDKYAGCPVEIAEALKNEKRVKGTFSDDGECFCFGYLINYETTMKPTAYQSRTGTWWENFKPDYEQTEKKGS